jgi:hypothetical protein
MSVSTGVGRGHGRHHHGPLGPRAKKSSVPGVTPVAPKPKGVGRGHGAHHHGATPKAHHPHPNAHHAHRKKVK